MPWLGLGVWQSKDGAQVEQAIAAALDIGYRHIDTAMIYQNEIGVGNAIKKSGISRDEIFLTTKVWNSDQGYQNTVDAFEESLRKLGTEYVDLYLIHWPVEAKFVDTWKALEELYHQGKAKAIGLSNFMTEHLEILLPKAEIAPMVNQIEFHPYLVQPDLLQFCQQNEIQVEAWSPIMQGRVGEVTGIQELATKYSKSPAQIVLRWDLQHEAITIPKTVKPHRLAENSQIFDFEISEEDMARLDELDRGERFGPDPYNFNF